MSIIKKIKTVDKKIERNKARYDLDRETAKIFAWLSGNVIKYEFLTDKDVLLEKNLLEKAATMKTFEYWPLCKELKAQTSVAEKQYQRLNKLFKQDEKEGPVTIKKEKPVIISESKLMHDNKYSFNEYKNVRKYSDLSFTSKYYKLLWFYHR